MTRAKTNNMIRELIFDALRRSRNNISNATVSYPRGGLFSNRVKLETAFKTASRILKGLGFRVAKGETFTPEQLNYSIDYEIALSSFMDAKWSINVNMIVGDKCSNEIQETREALKILRELIKQDPSPKEQFIKERVLAIHEKAFKETIGEE
jgi:hypothetical protein